MILFNAQAPTTFFASVCGSPLMLPYTHPGPKFLHSVWFYLLSNIHGFIIDSGLLSSMSYFNSSYIALHVVCIVLEAQWKWVKCQFALYSPLCFMLQGPIIARFSHLLLGQFANERHCKRLEDWRRRKARVFVPLFSVSFGMSSIGFVVSVVSAPTPSLF